jgi:hypothetical protein
MTVVFPMEIMVAPNRPPCRSDTRCRAASTSAAAISEKFIEQEVTRQHAGPVERSGSNRGTPAGAMTEDDMFGHHRLGAIACGAIALAAALALTIAGAQAFDESKYPDMQGQWARPPGTGIQWDPTKTLGRAQEPPLTPEYQAIWEASMADQKAGGQGNDPLYRCVPVGMPRVMSAVFPMEIVITPNTTYILSDYSTPRRIYTDGRQFSKDQEPNFLGYSIGKWIDENGDGRYDVLEVETRGPFKGPRAYDATGLPLHFDNQSVFEERIFRDKNDPSILHDEVTVIDHALTRPWTVDKKYTRNPNPRPRWTESSCIETNSMVAIGKESYFMSADGMLMPVRRNQPPPDLRYFKQWTK